MSSPYISVPICELLNVKNMVNGYMVQKNMSLDRMTISPLKEDGG